MASRASACCGGARPFTATLMHDGKIERVRTIQVSVGNGRHYGGGMTVAEEPGRMMACSMSTAWRSSTGGGWWRCCPGCARGTQGNWEDVRAFRTTALELRTRRPRPVNTDGELTTHTPAVFRLRPAALRVYAPPQWGRSRRPAGPASCAMPEFHAAALLPDGWAADVLIAADAAGTITAVTPAAAPAPPTGCAAR